MTADLLERFIANVTITEGCWEWLGKRTPAGYARFFYRRADGGEERFGYRFAYEAWNGPFIPRMHIDHLCRNHSCVNPDHLEQVTPRENALRAWPPTTTHCRRGHMYTDPQRKRCDTCMRMTVAERSAWRTA